VGQYGEELVLVTVEPDGAAIAQYPNGTVSALRIGEELGRTAVVNRAVAGLDAEVGWVAVTDPRVVWAQGAVEVLRAVAAQRPRAGLLGPRLCLASGWPQASSGPIPTLPALLRGRVPAAPVPTGLTGWLDGTCVLVRRVAWDSVGGYDARYPGIGTTPDPADVDLGERLGRAGWLVVGVPEAEVVVTVAPRQGILDPAGWRRYVADRHGVTARGLMMARSVGRRT